MSVCYDLFCRVADEHIDDVRCLEVLLRIAHDDEHRDEVLCCLDALFRMQAVVAVLAVVGFIFLAEIVEEHASAADRGLGVGSCLLQQLSADVLFSHGLSLHEFLEFAYVARCVEGDAFTFSSVAPCAPCFLIVSFEALGYIVVDYESHVRLVDAHAEGYCGHDDVDLVHDEIILCLRARRCVHTGVIGSCVDVVGSQYLGQFLNFPPREAVNDAALARVLLDELYDILVDILRLWPYFVVKVRAVERAAELCGVGHPQVFLDVVAHLVGSSGCEGDDWCHANLVDYWAYAPVFRPEVVPPFRDTVCFVDGIE